MLGEWSMQTEKIMDEFCIEFTLIPCFENIENILLMFISSINEKLRDEIDNITWFSLIIIACLLCVACGVKDRPEYKSQSNYKKNIKLV